MASIRSQENAADIFLIVSIFVVQLAVVHTYFQYLRRRIWKCKGLASLIPLDLLRDDDDVANIIEHHIAKL